MLYMKLIWCNGFAEIYAQLKGVCLITGDQTAKGICALFYIYRERDLPLDVPSIVAVFKASMLNWRGWGQFAIGICALFYI